MYKVEEANPAPQTDSNPAPLLPYVPSTESSQTVQPTEPKAEVEIKDEKTPESTVKEVLATFVDVKEEDWFGNAVAFVKEKGLMKGITEESFAPAQKTDRAMLVSILHRLDGEQKVEGSTDFGDVKQEAYYYSALVWASKNKIVSGYSQNEFKPNDLLTREQLATILMNYAKVKGYYKEATTSLDAFVDGKNISGYAQKAVAWAVENGLLKGKGNHTLDMKANTTRAEIAVIIERFAAKFLMK